MASMAMSTLDGEIAQVSPQNNRHPANTSRRGGTLIISS